jgi:protein TonB
MRHALIGSVALHAAVIAVVVERSTGPRSTRSERERIEVVSLSRPAPRPPEVSSPAPARQAPRGFQVLVAPVEIPTAVPDIDITRSATDEADFTGRGVAGGFASGVGGPSVATLPPVTKRRDDPIDEGDVEHRPAMLPGQMGPSYPDSLRDAGPDGAVVVRFVLDTAGRLEPRSLDIVKSSHPLFTESVRVALTRILFSPAELGGRKVRVRMEQRFEFHLAHR